MAFALLKPLPESAAVVFCRRTSEAAVGDIVVALGTVQAAGRELFFFDGHFHRHDEVAHGRDDDAQVDVRDHGVAAYVLIDDRLDRGDVLGDEEHAEVFLTGNHHAIHEIGAFPKLIDDLDGVLRRDVDLRDLEADLHEVHAHQSRDDARLLELIDARTYRRLG